MKKLICIFILLSVTLMGQSAYYRLGYGDLFPATDPLGTSLGSGVVALQDSARITLHNPAALQGINLVHFGVGLGSEFRSTDAALTNNTRLEQFFLAFPVGSDVGVSFGAKAVADFETQYQSTNASTSLAEKTDGGIWDYNLGIGYDLSETLKLGLKFHTYQGLLRREYALVVDDATEVYVIKGNISGKALEFAMLTNFGDKVSLGLTANIPYDRPNMTGQDSLGGSTAFTEFDEELAAWPTTINLGVVYHYSKFTNLLAGIGQEVFPENGFENSRVFALPDGWHTVPVASFQIAVQRLPLDRTSRSLSKRIGFQSGVSIRNYYLVPSSDNMMFEYALLTGLNVGLRNGKSIFDISGELGSRGGEESLPEELYARVKFGIQINDTWFRKVKRR